MATIEVLGAMAFERDRETIAVLQKHAPEVANAIAMTTGVDFNGNPAPAAIHLVEHQAFLSEAVAGLAAVVDRLATNAAPKQRGRPPKVEPG
jgi:hypothetical protein